MLFSEDWVKETNDSKTTKEPRLTVTYLNGFKGTTDFYKNKMTAWEVISATENKMEIQLTFSDSIWISQNVLPCFLELDFGDGQAFKSAGFGENLTENTVKRI
jgi:hypothetical protein